MNITIRIQLIAIIAILNIATIPLNIIHALAQTSETWKEYVDPQGEFSMQYPSHWMANIGNRFDINDVAFYSPGGSQNGFVTIQYNIFSENIESVMDRYNIDQSDLEDTLKYLFPEYLSAYTSSFEHYNQIEKIDYNNYQINGHKAASVIFAFEMGVEAAGWLVWTLIGSKTFNFAFLAQQDQFDKVFPVAEKMLNSIQISDTNYEEVLTLRQGEDEDDEEEDEDD